MPITQELKVHNYINSDNLFAQTSIPISQVDNLESHKN